MGSPLLVLDSLRLELAPSPQSLGHVGPSLLAFGRSRFDPTLPVLDLLQPGLGLFMRSLARLESAPSVLDFLHLGFITPPRSSVRLGLALFAFSSTRVGFSLLALDLTHVGLSLLLRSMAHPGFSFSSFSCCRLESFLLVPDPTQPEPSTLLQSLARLEPPFFPCGITCLGPLLLASDCVHLGLPLLPHSLS